VGELLRRTTDAETRVYRTQRKCAMTKQRTTTESMKTVTNLEEVTRFSAEQEEARYWQTHALGDELRATLHP